MSLTNLIETYSRPCRLGVCMALLDKQHGTFTQLYRMRLAYI
ncbi:hypothetical protein RAZWK3B_16895 [Roseobacter sp. AzwK-3b]|nr:hypothetical protein [Roseobacter sp. AzwK-3b]EDM71094.1 hypothetical protein RAZWK3B_16895 [Roseobacter sp. AzwK-3b]